ncbi:zinc-dependent alcohol dehydrogenase family protein [Roseibacillus ishigakijimensis]|uniref:NAD(P)-dependent alcohol dehydrogenase n=1 Tax=Roseibacillus ishigakijimensis TaxID=454146 RepID=A0A934RTP0_9BACT|nr:NAD(P)-dependent alcohol dehydrogenase [Roseibacillus ishigakijimensis]MBK1835451.1 NAD(P)-dependent alcohol dehydrogenase [Roseibacillus ishigakijimensis]
MKKYLIQPGEERIALTEDAEPEAAAGEVKIRLQAASLNYRDILNRKYSREAIVPFSDGAGEVVAVGEGVSEHQVGDRVVGLFFPNWLEGPIDRELHAQGRGGDKSHGMLAEYVVGPAHSFLPLPAHLSYEEAATLPCAGLTAWHALFETPTPAQKGDTVLIQGTGGVSIFALQLAVAYGLQSIVISSSDEKLARVREMGATHTLNYKTTPDWEKAVFELTGKKGVDRVIEVGGAGTLEKSMKAARFEGVISLIGVLTGLQAEVNPFPIVGKSLRVYGIYVGSRTMQENFHRGLSEHGITPIVDRVFPFAEANASYDYQLGGSHFGNIVVKGQ